MNEYGLFGNTKGRSIKIWHNERTSKYLLSYNYIPANFEGILIGPSVSDNIDTKKISGFKIYNVSIDGGNISELKYIVDNVIQKGNLKFIIICLYPYMTKDHGRKTSYIDPQEYWSSLGSRQTLNFYKSKLFIMNGIGYDYFNDYGYNNYNLSKEKGGNREQKTINNETINKKNTPLEFVDKIAQKELTEIVNLARKKGIKIFAFYYPYFIENYNDLRFKAYKEIIDKIFNEQDIIWNFNTNEYLAFRSDPNNYYDKGHLSWKGADYMIREINNKLNCFYGTQPAKER